MAGDFVPYPCHRDDRCFACGRPLSTITAERMVDTRDGQTVRVGGDCFRKVERAGAEGWQPPKGGPRLWLPDAALATGGHR
jgi:hypothetical protein